MKPGDRVRVRAYGGKQLERVIVQLTETTVVICTAEEYEKARAEGREPTVVGFPLKEAKPINV